MNISITEAKAKFSELVRRAEAGEEILITRRGKVVASMSPSQDAVRRPPLLGALKGQIRIAADFDEPLKQLQE